jgi:mono/diheme cytochrome c family protein
MTEPFDEDKIGNEKREPRELSSIKFVIVPLMLLSAFFGFGITYHLLRTPSMELGAGDSRTGAVTANAVTTASDTADPLAARMQKGKQLFTVTCRACHQADGKGMPPVFPPLDGSEWAAGPERRVIAIVLHGIQGSITVEGKTFNGVMPTFKDQFSDEQIADILTFVRNSWSNKAGAVLPETVKDVREKTASRTGPWNGGEELDAFKD